MSGAIAIQATALGRRYGATVAIRNLNLGIPSGRVVALVGPNGAGKTTLLRLCAGLDDPTSGNIEVLGWSGSALSPRIDHYIGDSVCETSWNWGDALTRVGTAP